tara:strand:- start:729 stop:977 length:249 start_codon:yes stop_codon:yes gene_type:complete
MNNLIDMNNPMGTDNSFVILSKLVEDRDPSAIERIKSALKSTDDESQMRYLEGLLLLMGAPLGELEDPPDLEDDPEEYWEEY